MLGAGSLGVHDGGAAVTAVADHFQGHPLHDRAHGPGIDHQGEVGMAVDVDDSRAYPQPGNVQLGNSFSFPDRANLGNSPVRDGQISPKGRSPCPVQDFPASQDQIATHSEDPSLIPPSLAIPLEETAEWHDGFRPLHRLVMSAKTLQHGSRKSFITHHLPTRLLISRRRLTVATGSTWPALSKTTP